MACAAPPQPLRSARDFQAAFSVSQSAPPSQFLYMLSMVAWHVPDPQSAWDGT